MISNLQQTVKQTSRKVHLIKFIIALVTRSTLYIFLKILIENPGNMHDNYNQHFSDSGEK